MIEEVLKNVYRIPVPLPGNPLKELNSYLFRGGHGDVLMDTGFNQPECREALNAGVRELGADPMDMDVLLTHLHSDHAGLASEFIGPGHCLMVNETEYPWLHHESRDRLWAENIELFRAAGFSREIIEDISGTNPAIRLAMEKEPENYHFLHDGAIVPAGDYTLRCVETPGHTPGHCCFWLEEEKTMFTGDHVLFDITPNITFWSNMEDPLGAYLDSLRRIREYPVELALPSHRKSGDFKERVDALIEHHGHRAAECVKAVEAEPGLCACDIAGRMSWRIRAKSWDEFPIAQKWFAVGECVAHLDYLRLRGALRREMDRGIYRYFPE